jgi:hypothetical protein
MKKLICLILGMMIAASCLSGLAESGETCVFVQIRENVMAKVYAKPGAAESVDTLQGGRICGLLEETDEAGEAWFCIFYLDSDSKGLTGYIIAAVAVKLSDDELTVMLANPDKFNEIMDLVDAITDYLGTTEQEETARTDTEAESGGSPAAKKSLKQFYEEAMDKLKQAFNNIGSVDLSGAADTVQEFGDKMKETGKDLLDQAKETAESVKDSLEEKADEVKKKLEDTGLGAKMEDVKNQLKDIDLDARLEEVKEKVKDIDPGAKLEELKEKLKNSELDEKIKDLKEKFDDSDTGKQFNELKTKTGDALQDQVSGLMEKLDGSDLMDRIQELKISVDKLKNTGTGLGEQFNAVKDELMKLISND